MSAIPTSYKTRHDRAIECAIEVPNYTNPIAYDPDNKSAYGYWLCKHCKVGVCDNWLGFWHESECLLADKENERVYNHKDIIYVLGPQENGYAGLLTAEDIEKVKQIALAQFQLKTAGK